MNTLSQLLRYGAVIGLMVPMLGTALLVSPVSSTLGWQIVRKWSRMALWFFGVAVELQYENEPSHLDQGGVFVGLTQQSLLDPTAGIAGLDRRFLSIWNIEYALIPFFGWVSFILGWVIIRQRPKQAKRQLEKAAAHASSGGFVFLSAEGKRSVDGELNPYKKGPVVLALQAQSPIHPVYIAGSRQCLPPGEWRIQPGIIILHCLEPIPTEGLTYEDRDPLLAKLRAVGEAAHQHWQSQ